MRTISRPRVKICCISSRREAALAIAHGASALGLVSEMPSGPGVISEEEIADIASAVPPPISTFLLTSLQDADAIADQVRRCCTNTVQLCDSIDGSHHRLRRLLPGVKIVQVIHVTGPESVDEARETDSGVDAILLDSGNPLLAVKELGGTGRTHDWALSRRIVESVELPVFLAGGLNSSNVADAISSVRPFGIDLCSGVRTGGSLDESKLSEFFAKI
ncbi:MAG: phosphoribosylanthranilate isomerase [Aridibacter famidurans]|nr:phosphoribosylanthranilate isomerase [Aridibacter famidurans]